MNTNDLVTLLGGIVAALNTGFLIYAAWKRIKPEVKRMETEVESELQEAANLNLEGAKVSATMLLDRINELKTELDTERRMRKESLAYAEKVQTESIQAIERARKDDAEYFRRRIKDLERESRDYRSWAAKLVKQVVDAGKIPVPFIPTVIESDPSIQAVRIDLESPDEE